MPVPFSPVATGGAVVAKHHVVARGDRVVVGRQLVELREVLGVGQPVKEGDGVGGDRIVAVEPVKVGSLRVERVIDISRQYQAAYGNVGTLRGDGNGRNIGIRRIDRLTGLDLDNTPLAEGQAIVNPKRQPVVNIRERDRIRSRTRDSGWTRRHRGLHHHA